MSIFHRPFPFWLLAVIFAALHTTVLVLISVLVFLSPDGESAMAYFLFNFIDWPSSHFFPQTFGTESEIVVPILALGTMQWVTIGFVLQSILVFSAKVFGWEADTSGPSLVHELPTSHNSGGSQLSGRRVCLSFFWALIMPFAQSYAFAPPVFESQYFVSALCLVAIFGLVSGSRLFVQGVGEFKKHKGRLPLAALVVSCLLVLVNMRVVFIGIRFIVFVISTGWRHGLES